MHPHHKPTMYGTATIGTKGQIVIPAEARADMNMNTGDKVVVLGIKENGMVCICPLSSVEVMLTAMTEKLETMRKIVDQEKKG